MQDEKIRLNVDIFGQQYKMVGKASPTHLRSVASFVDQKMKQIANRDVRLDTAKIAVLAAINITDEYFRLKEEYEELVRILETEEQKEDEPT